MRLEIEQDAEERDERKSNIPIELDRSYKKGGWLEPLEDPHSVMGNDLLNIVICVQGRGDYNLPEFAISQLTESVRLAKRYRVMLQAQIRDPQELVDIDLAAHLAELVVSFSRAAAEEAALADAENFEISEDLLTADKEKLAELGSFQALVDYHNNKQKENGLSVERIDQYLANDPHYAKIRTLVDKGVIIDTAADFQPIHRTAKFRNLQVRMLPV